MNKRITCAVAMTMAMLASQAGAADQPGQPALRDSFASKGMAGIERLEQSDAQRQCSAHARQPLPAAQLAALEQQALAAVRYPASGVYLGNWKEGEKVAQNGRGMQSSDDKNTVNGGNCYACHQLAKQEIAFGNIGPSLNHYGKLRGGPTPDVLKYTWAKIYNSHAFAACSTMPRFGAAGILDEQQIRDLMALLLDPASPVNQ